jgi:hypothetical protein
MIIWQLELYLGECERNPEVAIFAIIFLEEDRK